jgi:hypothetical protein
MQTVLPQLPMRAFYIALPSVTIFTIFLVFNLRDIVTIWGKSTQAITHSLRKVMQNHPRRVWRKEAEALLEDRAAVQIPVKKRARKSTHWMYFVFIFVTVLVTLPRHELKTAIGLYGLRKRVEKQVIEPNAPEEKGRAWRIRAVQEEAKRMRPLDRLPLPLRWIFKPAWVTLRFGFNSLRFLCLSIWIPLLILDLVVVLTGNLVNSIYRFFNPKPPAPVTERLPPPSRSSTPTIDEIFSLSASRRPSQANTPIPAQHPPVAQAPLPQAPKRKVTIVETPKPPPRTKHQPSKQQRPKTSGPTTKPQLSPPRTSILQRTLLTLDLNDIFAYPPQSSAEKARARWARAFKNDPKLKRAHEAVAQQQRDERDPAGKPLQSRATSIFVGLRRRVTGFTGERSTMTGALAGSMERDPEQGEDMEGGTEMRDLSSTTPGS